MNIHEYQAKELLAKFGVAVPKGIAAMTVEDAVKARRNALRINGETAERQTNLGEALVAAANGSPFPQSMRSGIAPSSGRPHTLLAA